MRNFCLLLGFIFFIAPTAYTQEVQDTSLINELINKSEDLKLNKEYAEAENQLIKALEIYESKAINSPKHKVYLLSTIGGFFLDRGDYAGALNIFENTLDYALESIPKNDKIIIQAYLDIGIANYYMGNYDIALLNYEYAENITLKKLGEDEALLSKCYNNIGICYYVKQNYKKALDFYKKALALGLKKYGENHLQIASTYNNIGICYKLLQDYNQAITYYNKALAIKQLNLPNDHPKLVPNYNNLGSCYNSMYKYDEALEFYQRGAEILIENFGTNHPQLADLYNNIGNCYSGIGEFSKAINHLKKSLEIREKEYPDFHPEIGNSLGNIGDSYADQRSYDKALEYFDKALAYFGQKAHEYPVKIGSYLSQKGYVYQSKKEYEKAIEMFDEALDVLHYDNTDFEHLERHRSPIDLLSTLSNKATALVKYNTVNSDPKLLFEAQKLFNESIIILEYLKTSFQESGSKQILLDNSFDTYEGAIAVCHQLHQISRDEKYLHQAFTYAEKSNGILLQEAVQKTRAERYANIPDTLLDKERDLKVDIAFYEAKRFNENQKGVNIDPSKINDFNNRIFNLKQKYFALMQEFEEKYPEYFELRYESKTVPVKEIQENLLKPNNAFIEYFVGDDHAFAFVITKDTFAMEYIPKNIPLEAWIEEFRNSIIYFSPLREDIRYLSQKYSNLAYELYEYLFAPIHDLVKEKSLTIVPGGILGYLPFEALLSELPEKSDSYRTHPYLINEFTISYNYSAFLLKEKYRPRKNDYSGNFLGIAPRFDSPLHATPAGSRTYELGALQYNIPEVEAIRDLMGGEIYIDSLATENNFRKKAKNYQILHLATHGKANDQSSDYSFLAFYELQDDIENELLYVKDLYNLDLQADMVVLSACETGIGELQRGEGIISLARGFFYAGVRSIITTLWSIDDKPTAEIMEDFYVNLKANQSKDTALRNAKLTYIKNQTSDTKTHPRYWAGFVPVGNMNPLTTNEGGNHFWLWGLGAIFLIGGVAFWWMNKS